MIKDTFKFSAASILKSNLWFSNYNFNGLFQLDLNTFQVKFVSFFTGESIFEWNIHKKSLVYGDKIIFLPNSGRYIHIYDTNKGDMIKVGRKRYCKEDEFSMSDAVLLNHKLWIFPASLAQPLLVLDMRNLSLQEVWQFNNWCSRNIKSKLNWMFCDVIVYKDEVWLPVIKSNIIVKFNFNTKELTKMELDVEELFGISKSKEGFWLNIVSGEKVVLWDPVSNTKRYFSVITDGITREWRFSHIIEFEEQVYAFPVEENMIYWLDPDLQCFVKKIDFPADFNFDPNIKFSIFMNYGIVGNELWMFPVKGNGILIIENMNKVKNLLLPIDYDKSDEEPYRSIQKSIIKETKRTRIIYESDFFSLRSYIQWLDTMDLSSEKKNSKIQICGKLVYNKVLRN